MRSQTGRAAFKDAVKRLESPDAAPWIIEDSPFAESLEAAILEAHLDERRLIVRFNCGLQYCQSSGHLQGGVLATMLDLSMAFVALAVLPAESGCATVQLNVHFLRPACPGQFHAEAEIEKLGQRQLFISAKVRPAGGGDPIASATGVFSMLRADV